MTSTPDVPPGLDSPGLDRTAFDPTGLAYDDRGLVTVVAVDGADGAVLMVAWANEEAIRRTIETGELHLWSRSRRRLWRKGETSGNVLHVEAMAADCDRDTVLVTVRPTGPACHRGTRSCFDDAGRPAAGSPAGTLAALEATIRRRAAARPAGSYTAELLAAGTEAVARKVIEEATEVAFAAKDAAVAERTEDGTADRTQGRVVEESADLLYHLLVLLAERGLSLADVADELRRRAGGPQRPIV